MNQKERIDEALEQLRMCANYYSQRYMDGRPLSAIQTIREALTAPQPEASDSDMIVEEILFSIRAFLEKDETYKIPDNVELDLSFAQFLYDDYVSKRDAIIRADERRKAAHCADIIMVELGHGPERRQRMKDVIMEVRPKI
jgi:hypothetical protein